MQDLTPVQLEAFERWKSALREVAKASDEVKAARRSRDRERIAAAETVHSWAIDKAKRQYQTCKYLGVIDSLVGKI